jgi:hypothetical protein
MTKEKILCAAIWYKDIPLLKNDIPSSLLRPINCNKGIVFCGYRHSHCMYQMVAIIGKAQYEVGEEIQGFLTNLNRFVDRKEGAKIHLLNGGLLKYSNITLYSEDLY